MRRGAMTRLQVRNDHKKQMYRVTERGDKTLFEVIKPTDTVDLTREDRDNNIITVPPGQTPKQVWTRQKAARLLKEEDGFDVEAASPKEREAYAEAKKSERDTLVQQVRSTDEEIARLKLLKDTADDIRIAWGNGTSDSAIDFTTRKLTIEKNEHSSLHRLQEALRLDRVFFGQAKQGEVSIGVERVEFSFPPDLQTFVVSHDWGAVLGDVEGDIKLPFPHCTFEFRFSGRVSVIYAVQLDSGEIDISSFVESKTGGWIRFPNVGRVQQQLRAVCIMLSAQVATHEVVRQPTALNAKRIKNGKPPLLDYHIVDLSKRHKSRAAAAPLDKDEPAVRMRLHVVRGHWRHYDTHKTFIEWHLRGDPDLGFIEKHYKL